MSSDELVKVDLEAGQRIQERVQFYFLTLTFTLLALSIQTALFSDNPVQIASELLGWAAFIISGVAGLHRMTQLPIYFKISVKQNALQQNLLNAEEQKYIRGQSRIWSSQTREFYDINEYIVEHVNGIKAFDERIKKLDKRLKPIISTHRICLLLGIILIAFSRATEGLGKLGLGFVV